MEKTGRLDGLVDDLESFNITAKSPHGLTVELAGERRGEKITGTVTAPDADGEEVKSQLGPHCTDHNKQYLPTVKMALEKSAAKAAANADAEAEAAVAEAAALAKLATALAVSATEANERAVAAKKLCGITYNTYISGLGF